MTFRQQRKLRMHPLNIYRKDCRQAYLIFKNRWVVEYKIPVTFCPCSVLHKKISVEFFLNSALSTLLCSEGPRNTLREL